MTSNQHLGKIFSQEKPRVILTSSYARKGKHILDYILTSILIVLIFPVMGFIAILIKISSRGPVFFCQKRIGSHNCLFVMYKFRSMYVDTPTYSETPSTSDDPRITPVGKCLRKISLDELPQLFNVLKGEMSLVGPRPEMPFLAQEYNDRENERHLVKPGITGLWQLSLHRSSAIRDGIHLDREYIENLSLWNDLKILLRTFRVLFDRKTY